MIYESTDRFDGPVELKLPTGYFAIFARGLASNTMLDLWDYLHLGGTGSLLSLFLAVIYIEVQKKRLLSRAGPSTRSRALSTSSAVLLSLDSERIRAQQAQSSQAYLSRVKYHGPLVDTVPFATWTPPPTWAEASTALLPQKATRLGRELSLSVLHETLTIKSLNAVRVTRDEFTLPANEVSIQGVPPAAMGVLELFLVQDDDISNRMEHTFASSSDAAQFQQDLMVVQIMGAEIMSIYHALQLLHRGSSAHEGPEVILHQCRTEEINKGEKTEPQISGVAWDDMMRALIHIDGIRDYLDQVLARKREHTDATKRLLLGPVDVFRAFSPPVLLSATPDFTNRESRFEHVLKRRKMVAQAAVHVQAYLQAQRIVNLGWNLWQSTSKQKLTRRLAYDENFDNLVHDQQATNEYYEATVSRDVVCPVRMASLNDTISRQDAVGKIQAFKLVGFHIFRLPSRVGLESFPLLPDRDPVEALPSLRSLIAKHPRQKFFVTTYYPPGMELVFVQVFVRSIPVGVDEDFDKSLQQFWDGDEDFRSRTLHCAIQMGVDRMMLSVAATVMLWIVSLVLGLIGRKPVDETTTDRTALPTLPMRAFGSLCHFGGALASKDLALPTNYVAFSCQVDVRALNLTTLIILLYLERVSISEDVLDISFFLSSPREGGATPTRAISSIRLVRLWPLQAALPSKYVYEASQLRYASREMDLLLNDADEHDYGFSWYFRALITDPSVAVLRSLTGSGQSNKKTMPDTKPEFKPKQSVSLSFDQGTEVVAGNSDPVDAAVDVLIDILRDAAVPVRKDQLIDATCDDSPEALSSHAPRRGDGGPPSYVEAPVLRTVSRDDIRRYFVACQGSFMKASVRLVESAAWRGLTFPIDVNSCRVELMNGQFFQQGVDLKGKPVFYFRNTLLGPWRDDGNAVIAAVLHRLETCLVQMASKNPLVKCTIIILMGKPYERKHRGRNEDDLVAEGSVVADECSDAGETYDETNSFISSVATTPESHSHNPRIDDDENYYTHTDKDLIYRLIDTLEKHYPERLHKALVVFRHGNNSYARTAVRGVIELSKLVQSSKTRQKVSFLTRYADLRYHVSRDELVTLAGGHAPVHMSAYECE